MNIRYSAQLHSTSAHKPGLANRLALTVAAACVFMLSGCAMQKVESTLPFAQSAGITGKLMGGQQPVSGAYITLRAAGSNGYGIAASGTANLLASTTTDSQGGFKLPAYTCPTSNTLMWIQAQGGNPGLAPGTFNDAIFETALLGLCGNLSPATFINISEVTTVATAYAVRPFLNGTDLGTSATNYQGLNYAMQTYDNLVDNRTGTSPGANVPTGASIPSAQLNSLANSLSECVNTAQSTSTACAALLGYVGVPTTTGTIFDVASQIANTPGMATAATTGIFNLASANAPFQPALSVAPRDWTLGITYTGGNLNSPQTALDVDSTGNVWVTTLRANGTLEELSPLGQVLQTNLLVGILNQPMGLAVDQIDSVVVTSSKTGSASVVKVDKNGGTVYNVPYGAPRTFTGVAIDLHNFPLVADPYFKDILGLGGTGGTLDIPTVQSPQYLAVDANNRLYASTESPVLKEILLTLAGGQIFDIGENNLASGASLGGHIGLDHSGHIWWAGGNKIFEFIDLNDRSYTVALFEQAFAAVKVDGLGIAIAGFAISTPDQPLLVAGSAGLTNNILIYLNSPLQGVNDMSIDRSGNIWLANAGSGGLFEVVGLASPLLTPTSQAALQNKIAIRP